ncbi:MAG: Bax inhibitor-1/YccA family protein [Prevotella sp.]|nr:Bax inhibitor-1/YccA family protein [Prevotella sp.]
MDLQQFEKSIREDASSSVRQQEIVSSSTFSTLMRKVYTWMALALAITGFTAYYVASSPAIMQAIFSNRILFWGLLIGELALVWIVSASINRLSLTTATAMFILYSVLNGVTLSFIFLAYTMTSITTVFFITAGTFAAMSLYGYFTKTDLSKMGQIMIMALIGLIIATIVNLFVKSSGLTMILSYVGVLIFVGLTAWDTQKIKEMLQMATDTGEAAQKIALMGALSIYLDFINLFLYLLRIFGSSRN